MGDFKNIQWLSKLFPLKFCQHYVLQKINWNVLYFGHFGRLWNRKRKHEKKQQTTLPTQMASAKVFGLFVSALFFKNMWQRFIFYLNRAKENLSFQSWWLQGKMSLFFQNGLLDYFFFFFQLISWLLGGVHLLTLQIWKLVCLERDKEVYLTRLLCHPWHEAKRSAAGLRLKQS